MPVDALFNCHVAKCFLPYRQLRYVVLFLNGTLTETPVYGSALDEVRFG